MGYAWAMPESLSLRPTFDDVPPARRRNLAAVAGKDTAPELVVRRLLHRMGYTPQVPACRAAERGRVPR